MVMNGGVSFSIMIPDRDSAALFGVFVKSLRLQRKTVLVIRIGLGRTKT